MGSPHLVAPQAGTCPERAGAPAVLAPRSPTQVGTCAPSHPVPCPPSRPYQNPSTLLLMQVGGHMASPHSVHHTGKERMARPLPSPHAWPHPNLFPRQEETGVAGPSSTGANAVAETPRSPGSQFPTRWGGGTRVSPTSHPPPRKREHAWPDPRHLPRQPGHACPRSPPPVSGDTRVRGLVPHLGSGAAGSAAGRDAPAFT